MRIAGFKSYLVFYLPRRDEVQVLAVLHGARDLPTVMEERL
jgi:plasmid stabilization system protein ParE